MKKRKYNPYDNPTELGLAKIEMDHGSGYEWDTLVFWATQDGKVYKYSGSGCSCNSPYDDMPEGETAEEVMKNFERVGSIEQALRIYDSNWHTDGNEAEKHDLKRWLEQYFKQ